MLSRSLDKARSAFKKKDVKATIEAHHSSPEHEHQQGGQYIKSLVYGGLDGIITTFAIVAGVAGAALSESTVLILGIANLIADGLSMAAGDYLSTKAEQEYYNLERSREEWEVENHPEGEKREVMEIYISKGYSKADAKKLTNLLAKNKRAWVDMMMTDELGLSNVEESPTKNAITTFGSFVVFGFVPLVAYVIAQLTGTFIGSEFLFASILTGLTLFALGAAKVKFTGANWFKSGLEMLFVGGLAAIAAYGLGHLVAGII